MSGLEFGKCWFLWSGKEIWRIRRKTLGAKTTTNSKLDPLMKPVPGFEPAPHERKARALATAPPITPAPSVNHPCSQSNRHEGDRDV